MFYGLTNLAWHDKILCLLGNFACFFTLSNISGILSLCQTVWIQIRPSILSSLIMVQTRPPDKSVYWKINYLISQRVNQNICCGYSYDNPKHMIKLMGKEINAILGAQTILILTYANCWQRSSANATVT